MMPGGVQCPSGDPRYPRPARVTPGRAVITVTGNVLGSRCVGGRCPFRATQSPAAGARAPASTGHTTQGCQALPRIRFILVPQTGQVPLAIRRPLVSAMSPSKSRLSLHFTQYPL